MTIFNSKKRANIPGTVRIAESRTGLGVFVRKNLSARDVIVKLEGRLIRCDIDDDIDELTRDNAIRYDDEFYLSADGGVGDFLNHSCNPNAYIEKRGKSLYLIARRAITEGQEIRFDYSTITASDDSWTMKCCCGSTMCRMVIRQFTELPTHVSKQYIGEGLIPSYILE